MLPYIQAINEAHLIMLMEQGIVDEKNGNVILKALGDLDQEFYKNTVYDGRYEDLYFYMESRLIEATDGIAGNLHLARSRNDMCVAWSHMAVRDGLLQAMEQFLYLKNAIVLFAEDIKTPLYVFTPLHSMRSLDYWDIIFSAPPICWNVILNVCAELMMQ